MLLRLHSEALKARSGFLLLGSALAACFLDAVSMLGTASGRTTTATGAELAHELVGLTVGAVLVSMAFGVLFVTNEYRTGAIGRTILLGHRRGQVICAKLLVAAGAGVVIAAGALASGLLVAHAAVREATGYGLVLDRETVLIAAGVLIASPLAAAWGTFLGWLIRHQALALSLSLAWTLGVDSAMLDLAPRLGRFLPGGAEAAIYRDPTPHLLPMPLGILVYVAWLLVAGAVVHALLQRRDLV